MRLPAVFGLVNARPFVVPDAISLDLTWTKAGVTAALAPGTSTRPTARSAAATKTPQYVNTFARIVNPRVAPPRHGGEILDGESLFRNGPFGPAFGAPRSGTPPGDRAAHSRRGR